MKKFMFLMCFFLMCSNAVQPHKLPTYTLNITPIYCTVSKTPNQVQYDSGTRVILYVEPEQNYSFSHWSGDLQGSGIVADFLIKKSMSVFAICTSSVIDTTPVVVPKLYEDSVPEHCPHVYALPETTMLPIGFSAVVSWMQAVHNPVLGITSCVEVDYFRLFSIDSVRGNATYTSVLVEEDYNTTWDPVNDGGLYSKGVHWFSTDSHASMPAVESGGILHFCPSDIDSVWHWWSDRSTFTDRSKGIFVESKVRLSGGACIQLGADWWRSVGDTWAGYNVNNKEVGVSRWYFADTGWQTIRFFPNK